MEKKAFSEEFKKIRTSMGMSQSEMASYLSMPTRTWQDWEHGQRTPPTYILEWIKKIVEYENKEKQNKINK